MNTRTSPETAALAKMVYEAVRFANWAAGEGFCPVPECKDAIDPAVLLSDYVTAIDGDDYEGLAEVARDAIARAYTAPSPAQSPQASFNCQTCELECDGPGNFYQCPQVSLEAEILSLVRVWRECPAERRPSAAALADRITCAVSSTDGGGK